MPGTTESIFKNVLSSEANRFVAYAVYKASNNLMNKHDLYKLLEGFKQHAPHLLRNILRHRIPTVQAFSIRILQSVTAYDDADLLQFVLGCGVDRNLLAGPIGRDALFNAFLFRGKEHMIDPLLGAGANPERVMWISDEIKFKNGSYILPGSLIGSREERLAKAVQREDLQAVTALLEFGANVDSSIVDCSDYAFLDTLGVLDYAFLKGFSDIYEIMFKFSLYSQVNLTTHEILAIAMAGQKQLVRLLECKQTDGNSTSALNQAIETYC